MVEVNAGDIFGKLTVLAEAESIISNQNKKITRKVCKCECGNVITVRRKDLVSGNTTSCGCSRRTGKLLQVLRERNSKYNTYSIEDNVVTVSDAQGKTFLIDTEDLDKIQNKYFSVRTNGYVEMFYNGRHIKLHRLLTNCPNDKVIDHVNGITTDNRKCNLRICSQMENVWNRPCAGVSKKNNGWQASISVSGKKIYLGVFHDRDEAIAVRRKAEIKYHGEFRRCENG